jgi:hypothetical protein
LNAEHIAALASFAQRPAKTASALERRIAAEGQLWRFREAADDCGRWMQFGLDQVWDGPCFLRGCLLAYLEDRDAYESHSGNMLDRFRQTTSRGVADRTAKMYFLVPRSAEECRRAMPLVDHPLDAEPGRGWFNLLKGLAEYRSGNFDDAVGWLNKARDKEPSHIAGVATVELLLAMSHHRLGHAEQACAAFDRAKVIIDTKLFLPHSKDVFAGGPDWLICHVILREAEGMMTCDARATHPH